MALTPKLLFPKFFPFLFLGRRGHNHLLILGEVLFGHDILEELERFDHILSGLVSIQRSGEEGAFPTPAPGGATRGGTTCGRLLVVGGTDLGPFGGSRPRGPLGPLPFLSFQEQSHCYEVCTTPVALVSHRPATLREAS